MFLFLPDESYLQFYFSFYFSSDLPICYFSQKIQTKKTNLNLCWCKQFLRAFFSITIIVFFNKNNNKIQVQERFFETICKKSHYERNRSNNDYASLQSSHTHIECALQVLSPQLSHTLLLFFQFVFLRFSFISIQTNSAPLTISRMWKFPFFASPCNMLFFIQNLFDLF